MKGTDACKSGEIGQFDVLVEVCLDVVGDLEEGAIAQSAPIVGYLDLSGGILAQQIDD